jgi:predicted amidohydrolase
MTLFAAIQMAPRRSLAENLLNAERLIASAVNQGAQCLVLPENFAYFGAKDLLYIAAQESSPAGPVRRFLHQQAKKNSVWIVAGTIPVADASSGGKKGFASCFCYDTSGVEVACYQKIHLFDVAVTDVKKQYRESDNYQAGVNPVVVETPFGKIGLSVCYDLRFAELYRQLADRGADIIVVPSAFTAVTGKAHWELLLRARAVENQVFVVGANMGDRSHSKTPTWGGSTIIHPWGNVLADMCDGDGVVIADIDISDIVKLKQKMPIAKHRRL